MPNAISTMALDLETINQILFSKAVTIAGHKYTEIPVGLLEPSPEFQRPVRGHEKKIAANWDYDKCGDLLVSYRDGHFYIIDGQHRWLAATSIGVKELPCRIYENLTIEDEARLFVEQTEGIHIGLTPRQVFTATLLTEDERGQLARTLKKICDEYQIVINPREPADKPILSGFRAAQTTLRLEGETGLKFAFDIIRNAGWHMEHGAYSETMLIALRNIYRAHKKETGAVSRCLSKALSVVGFSYILARAECSTLQRGTSTKVWNLLEEIIIREHMGEKGNETGPEQNFIPA